MARISVCMATYNGAPFVDQQLRSILNQLAADDEVIISDDSSSDQTVNIIKKLNDPRIILLEHQAFRSPMLNFENALKHATGDYIFLSDQDDIWEVDKVNDVVLLLSEFDLVLSDCSVVNNEGAILSESFFSFRGSRPGFWYNLYKNSYIGCCMAFRREILSYILPFTLGAIWHDWWIGLLVEVKGRAYFYDKPLIRHVRHGANLSPTSEGGYGLTRRIQMRVSILWQIIKRLVK